MKKPPPGGLQPEQERKQQHVKLGFICQVDSRWSMLPTIDEVCDPTYAKVDEVLDLITKSKSLHVLMVLDRSGRPLRFTEIKVRVEASSTTVSRRLSELEKRGLVVRLLNPESPQSNLYALTDDGRRLSPIMQNLFDWAQDWNREGSPES